MFGTEYDRLLAYAPPGCVEASTPLRDRSEPAQFHFYCGIVSGKLSRGGGGGISAWPVG